ncbi:hypothetical protein [uncultured Propionivibrio sp.]|uniref:hypothetical protein n=1 Tax=uncultured Propionivibrio sp. TaxID=426737 RepID=UPI0029BFB160|nr:hypothetical protein [uncultured Propionivibrio sp.]
MTSAPHRHTADHSTPPAYIISPFKRIKTVLAERLGQSEVRASAAGHGPQAPKTTELRDWCKERIGTVHTFQGKEESFNTSRGHRSVKKAALMTF